MERTLTYGLTHLAIGVRDLNRTRKFYQAIFNMEVMYHEKEFLQLTTPGCHDILVFEKKSEVQPDGGGIAHFGFRIRNPHDIPKIHKKAITAGATIIDQGEFVPGSPYIFFSDPDGYTIEVWYELLTDK
jgi:catechol 2,3-dioxygenase-like lactoylglutathione lyase family enzyme